MIFERVTLHNFGPYCGQHHLDLTVPPGKPVIAIGALNGSGKTTLLDAMQLALYGKNARCTGRERVGYPEYLASMINRDAPPAQAAGVAFTFRSRTDGHDAEITVNRTWRRHGAGVREQVEVYRGEEHDVVASDRWAEFVEELMPSQIADLFFFDGEKVEALADPQRSSALLKVGVHSLLGIDLVESLVRSLLQVERKRKTTFSSREDRAVLDELERESHQLQEAYAAALQCRAAEQNQLDLLSLREREAERRFASIGGDLFNKREIFHAERKALASEVAALDAELRDLAAGVLPLVLAHSVLESALSSSKSSRRAHELHRLAGASRERDADIVKFISTVIRDRDAVSRVKTYLKEDLAKRYGARTKATLVPDTFSEQYSSAELSRALQAAERVLLQRKNAQKQLAAVEAKLDAVPSDDAVAEAQGVIECCRKERSRMEATLELREEELIALNSKIERITRKAESETERLGEHFMNDSIGHRIIAHARRSRLTLARFRERLLAENIKGLERAILSCFQRLMRKTQLVHGIVLDPATFQISVHHGNDRVIPAERLSAGERQLLAVATLWALAQASGRHLPAVIDTPLSRLDSAHRGTLVRNYFPVASHQVILLSTDEELVGRYYEMLKPYVGREYLIEHDEAMRTSRFTPGYFSSAIAEAA